jgi:hypothetical protein
MAMNVTGNNMLNQAQMMGLPQQTAAKKIEHQQETTVAKEPEKQQESQQTPRDTFTKDTGQEQPKTHQRKVNQVMTRYISETGKNTDAQKAQSKDTDEARRQEHARESETPHAKVPLDNASRIGLMYKSQQRQEAQRSEGRVQNDNNNQPQQKQLRSFLSNLKEYVSLEYKQYGTTENSLYSRRNLREILTALGYETKAFDNKISKDRKDRTSAVSNTKSYNKNYEIKAQNSLKLFTEDPMQQNSVPFDMVA